MSTLWRRRQEELPEGSANRRQGQRRSPECQRPGAAEEAPRILRATRAPPKAGAARPLPQPWGRQKSPGNGDKRHGTGETRARGPPGTWKLLDAVQRPPLAIAGSAASTHRPPPPPAESTAGARYQLRSQPAAPCPVRRMVSARLFLCVLGTHDVPATLQGQSLCEGRPFPNPRAPRSPETVGKGSERAPIEIGE